MDIVKATNKDIPALVNLAKEIIPDIEYYPKEALFKFLEEYTPEFFRKLLKKDSVVLLAKENKESLGFAFGWDDYGVYWLDWIGVKKEHRGKGIATQLLNAFEVETKKKGGHKVHLDTSQTNVPAINLYKKYGYTIDGYLNKHWLKWNYVLFSKILR